MLSVESIFILNLFDDHNRISIDRFYNFGDDFLDRVKAQNNGGAYQMIVDDVEPRLMIFRSFVSDVSVGIAQQLGITRTSDEVRMHFGTRMSELSDGVSFKLKGKKTSGYMEIYPHGVSEYYQLPKEVMAHITDRVYKAAVNQESKLGVEIADELKGFKAMWETAHGNQSGNKTATSTHRNERDKARLDVELAITRAIYKIADLFGGDPQKCSVFVDFQLLYHDRHDKKQEPPVNP